MSAQLLDSLLDHSLSFIYFYFSLRIMKVATQFRDQGLSFAVADRQEFQDELEEEFGVGSVEGGGIPLVTIRTRVGHKYFMREEFT